VAFLIATLWVWQRYAVVQAGHRIAEHRAELAHLIETRDALLAENTTLTSRVRIESITAPRLGLKPTRDNQIIRIHKTNTDELLPLDANGNESEPPAVPEPAAKASADIASP
jgi:hypothetical protein